MGAEYRKVGGVGLESVKLPRLSTLMKGLAEKAAGSTVSLLRL